MGPLLGVLIRRIIVYLGPFWASLFAETSISTARHVVFKPFGHETSHCRLFEVILKLIFPVEWHKLFLGS